MEFPFNINDLLPDEVTLVDENVAPFRGRIKLDRLVFSSKQVELKRVIDMMGDASATSQNLKAPITSAMKLSLSDHKLYVLKDPSANSGNGAVVGIIKIGYKKLFLLDYQGVQHEVNPLCVLDFYVHESRQRMGCGKALFQHVIQMEGIEPHMLAIDRPSPKFLAFLQKHYGLDKAVPQVNNFVVFVEFFRDLQAVGEVQRRNQSLANRTGAGRPPIHPYKRPSLQNEYLLRRRQNLERASASSRQGSAATPQRPASTESIQKTERETEALKDINLPPIVPRPPGRHSASRARESSAGSGRWALESSFQNPQSAPPLDAYNTGRGMAARATSYSRHSLSREGSGTSLSSRKGPQMNEGGESGLGNVTGVSSGGKKRSLHLTSSGNPFYVGTTARLGQTKDNQSGQVDVNANQAASPGSGGGVDPRFISATGNYSVSKMYDSVFGNPTRGGTGWNIFGVNPGMSNKYPQRRGQPPRTLPF